MGKALYRKYRPKKLSEVVGQEHITGTLERAFQKGVISHAYLLTGPRGVGKTSIARIIAHEVNGLPYDEEATHLDVIEIDAASNRRIDEIRELKDRVHVAPTSAKYKVYIIDEVHMLTKEAFNALLKTLEEPPEHAIFILATTEAHKVPETIISRTQRFSFKPVTIPKVTFHLKQIAKKEKITIEDSALELIATHGEGSFRDSISLLDQTRHVSDNKVTLENVQQALGQAPEELLDSVINALRDNDVQAIAKCLADLRDHGVQAALVAHQLSQLLRRSIVSTNQPIDTRQAVELMKDLLQVPASPDAEVALELALYGRALAGNPKVAGKAEPPEEITRKTEAPKKQILTDQPKQEEAPKSKPLPKEKNTEISANGPDNTPDGQTWQAILSAIKAKHNTLYSVVRMANPEFTPNKLSLTFHFAFHQKRLDDNKNKQLLLEIIKEVTGKDMSLECLVNSKSKKNPVIPVPAVKTGDTVNLEAISNIFGGAEIVE